MSTTHLAIQISEHSVQFVSLRQERLVNEHLLTFSSTSSEDKKAAIQEALSSVSFLSDDFDEYTLSWSAKKSTLVPNAIFADSSPRAIFELCYGKDGSSLEIDYNRIAELSIVNVYEIPDWIKRLFVMKFPRINIQHEGTHILRNAMNSLSFDMKATVVIYKNYFQLTMVKHNNLEFYSFFDYQSDEDILYHLLFALQQKEFTEEKGNLELVLGSDAPAEIISALSSNIKRVKDIELLNVLTPEQYISKAQLLCV